MSEIQCNVNVANNVAIDVITNVFPVWWIEVYPFRVYQSELLLHTEIKLYTVKRTMYFFHCREQMCNSSELATGCPWSQSFFLAYFK